MKKTIQNTPEPDNHRVGVLQLIHEYKIRFDGFSGSFTILGRLSMDLSAMKISVTLERADFRKQRLKIDLYDYSQIEKRCCDLSEKEGFDYVELEADFYRLADLLEAHREELYQKEFNTKKEKLKLSLPEEKQAIGLLSSKYLMKTISKLLDDIGIVGETDNRLLLFIVGTSYKSNYQLHSLVQSTSGSGKSHLINSIAQCFPKEDVISFSRVTSKSLYHYKGDDLTEKLLVIQDMDGLDSEALYALRELQSLKSLTTSTTQKDQFGNMKSKVQTIHAKFASFGATTKTVYLDNESRSILLKVDESEKQTRAIIESQHELDRLRKSEAETELSNMVRVLKSVDVINPFAQKIALPDSAKMLRRLNKQFLDFVNQITYLHQFQRKTDKYDRIITTKADVKLGIELFFDSIWLKIDELNGPLRAFFEQVKSYVKEQGDNEYMFTQIEIRQAFNVSTTTAKRHLKTLVDMEYILIDSRVSRIGNQYQISFWDDLDMLRKQIKEELLKQLAQ
ncbi:MAG: hypothetical protein HRT58_21850 [Crocinitomicaceae bacterium]|nr:hypothetical protein [Flavobacteriales bacterium]NQZ38319.1 hypothetical protein [Crocinitomicaceae bacterium]